MRILVIEDELLLAGSIARTLSRYGHSLCTQRDGMRGLQAALEQPHDLVVLDQNLPPIDGRSVLVRLRQARCSARVLMLSDRIGGRSRIRGLRSTTDDCLAKPFAMDELVHRVEALGRRPPGSPSKRRLKLADLELDVSAQTVTRAGKPLTLSFREFSLLHLLIGEPGRIFSRSELCERVWRCDHEYGSRTVEMFVSRLRRKIDAGAAIPLLHTIWAVGYTMRLP
jgi:DNA-binding response OmpR family regulator